METWRSTLHLLSAQIAKIRLGWIIFAMGVGFIAAFLLAGPGALLTLCIIAGVATGFLLIAESDRVWEGFGSERQAALANGVKRTWNVLVQVVILGAIMVAIYVFWDVPDIFSRPLAALTLSDIGQSLAKLGVLVLIGSGILRAVFDPD
jgi:hypothetical protein